jgi:hypothetical protein
LILAATGRIAPPRAVFGFWRVLEAQVAILCPSNPQTVETKAAGRFIQVFGEENN